MFSQSPEAVEFSEAWIDGDERRRWRSGSGHSAETGARASGSSILEVDPGCLLPRHTDSAEEVIVVLAGCARVTVGEETEEVSAGGVAVVPECVPHEVESFGDEALRFAAIYAGTDVVTTYETDVQPDGGRERKPAG